MKNLFIEDETRDYVQIANSYRNISYTLRLFISGTTARSERAIQNLHRICSENFSEVYNIEIIDIFQSPGWGKEAKIVVTPTLIRSLPLPVRRIIGDLSDEESVLAGLEITINN